MSKTALILKFLVAAFLLAQTHCAPGGAFDATSKDGETTTGFSTPTGKPYTVGGDQRVIEDNRNPAPVAPDVAAANKQLAAQIVGVRFARYSSGVSKSDEDRKDRFGKKDVRVEIELQDGKRIRFQAPLIPAGATGGGAALFRTALVSGTLTDFQISAEFEDETKEQKYISGKIHLAQMDRRKRAIAQLDIFVRSYAAAVSTTLSTEQTLNPTNKRFVKLLEERSFAWVTNIVVQSGRSYYEVSLFAHPGDGGDAVDRAVAGTRLFGFAGEAVRTGDFTDAPATAMHPGVMAPLSVELIGDAEDTDQRTFAIILKGDKDQNIDLAIKIEKPEGDAPKQPVPTVPTPPTTFKGMSASSYLAADTTNPRVKKMIDDFEINYALPGVQKSISTFTTNPRSRTYLVNGLDYAEPFRPIVETIFHNYGIAPAAALVTFIESSFFAGGKYLLETAKTSTASGPLQLILGTARGMGMKVFNHKIGQLPPAGDHRLFFVPSACGAAEHFQKSLDSIAKRDSTMAIAAYYLGNGGVAQQIHKAITGAKPAQKDLLRLINKYNLMYKDVSRQHMLPGNVIDYVNRALALYFVTGNPIEHGFKWDNGVVKGLPAGKVMPPLNEISNPLCRTSVTTLIRNGVLK